ncbi:MAG TPA: glycosyltransferase [Victivallis vadensis]|nr:glycosyltransferase [Victivallis vadensis]
MTVNQHSCVDCAIKHLASAVVIAREILTGYNTPQYRLTLIGNLNEAQEQLSGIDPKLANHIRSLRLKLAPEGLELAFDQSMIRRIELCALAADWRQRHGLYRKAPDREAVRTAALPAPRKCRCSKDAPVDVLVPLSADGSISGNDELRFALRSIERNLKGYRNLVLVSDRPPAGFGEYRFIQASDVYPRKQMNIHHALMTAFRAEGIADEVIFWADDNVLLEEMHVTELPVAARRDGLLGFSNAPDARIWHRSLRNTGEALRKAGYPAVNYEAHTPVRFNKERYLALEREFDFYSEVGLCYISLYLNRYGVPEAVPMTEVKATCESETVDVSRLAGKRFLGYHDAAAPALFPLLRQRFPEPSKWERFPKSGPLYSGEPRIGVVLGTFGSAPHIDLGLHWLVRVNRLPVLVVDDGSDDARLEEVCARYGAQFLRLPVRHGHWAGDMRIFAEGLEWAAANGIELLVKLSRRFIPTREWAGELAELARASNAVTFSSYTTSYGYGFRTEATGMLTAAWAPLAEQLRKEAQPGKRIFVEQRMHRAARQLTDEWLTPEFAAYRQLHCPGRGRSGYALWSALLGTDRKRKYPGLLWHNANPPEEYAEAARQAGLPYRVEDFR